MRRWVVCCQCVCPKKGATCFKPFLGGELGCFGDVEWTPFFWLFSAPLQPHCRSITKQPTAHRRVAPTHPQERIALIISTLEKPLPIMATVERSFMRSGRPPRQRLASGLLHNAISEHDIIY